MVLHHIHHYKMQYIAYSTIATENIGYFQMTAQLWHRSLITVLHEYRHPTSLSFLNLLQPQSELNNARHQIIWNNKNKNRFLSLITNKYFKGLFLYGSYNKCVFILTMDHMITCLWNGAPVVRTPERIITQLCSSPQFCRAFGFQHIVLVRDAPIDGPVTGAD